ncbi:MAG: DNA cytosine methyltransferase [Candidatus Pseudomonas phytovorans]|uniref:Cytosine-specific methyltransferase n=1 Tax=Candidatus Pseudomonas phytovorans TaxID=3121377 RepID=A0AAJ5WJI9_9PSED|nr:DNA cytosine methyltransferase [Pseudomonas sp.]WEK33041.1 MAG: DNA cytosine methyltransferase [Pseudomonas sp.]
MSGVNFEPSVVSLFAGCGGLDIGFKELGFDLIYACDNDPAAIATYKANIDERAYVRDVRSAEFHSDMESLGSCDVVLGGFPCQGFSKAGPKRQSDDRNLLYLEMKSAVEKLRPKIFLAENVDGLSQNFKGSFLQTIVNEFKAVGYDVIYKLFDSAAFGVSQHRRRIYFIGVREDLASDSFVWPKPTNDVKSRNGESAISMDADLFSGGQGKLAPVKTISDAMSDLEMLDDSVDGHKIANNWKPDLQLIFSKIGPGQKLCNVRHSDTSVYTWRIPDYFGPVTENEVKVLEAISKNRRHKKYGTIPNGNPLPLDVISHFSGVTEVYSCVRSLLEKNYLKEISGKFDLKGAMFCSGLYKRPLWHAPSPTVLTNFHNPRYFLHPKSDRPFSLRECARLQGFPDDFKFEFSQDTISLVDGYRLVGNAVSPPVGRVFAQSIHSFLLKEANFETASCQSKSRRKSC